MNTLTKGHLVEDCEEFFAPMASDLIDGLIGEYQSMNARIHRLAEAVSQEQFAGALHHFTEGNMRDDRHGVPSRIGRLFDVEGAIAHLNASYWDRALKMTDVMDYMPQKRRDEWYEQIKNPLGRSKNKHTGEDDLPPLPPFEEETVRSTLMALMQSRQQFFAERVDGIFRALSRSHVTNQPEGFSKRMILNNVISSYGTVEYRTAGVIDDLRCVIAKFTGREEVKYGVTCDTIQRVRKHNGEWHSLDGGTLRMRVYNGVGTAHLEVHPEMAWRLNGVLASLHPTAIPEKFRTKPKRERKLKNFVLMDKPLPFPVIGMLSGMKPARERIKDAGWNQDKTRPIRNALSFSYGSEPDKHVLAQTERVLAAVGGVKQNGHWKFDYDPHPVIDEIIISGCIPDHKSHQFYPTPSALAEKVVELAMVDAEAGMNWLEPSAGTGNLADLVPDDMHVTCYEISPLHCKVLEAKGYQTVGGSAGRQVRCIDFLALAKDYRGGGYDRVIMNPPFDQGRWQAHLEAAAKVLGQYGSLIAILPASAKGKDVLDTKRFSLNWSQVYENEFAGTCVDVVILAADKIPF